MPKYDPRPRFTVSDRSGYCQPKVGLARGEGTFWSTNTWKGGVAASATLDQLGGMSWWA